MTTSWAPRRLRIAAEILNACEHEEAIAALIAGVAPKMEQTAVVKLGEVRQAEAALGSVLVGACLLKNSGSRLRRVVIR
jgi:hypothetical protein